MVQPERRGDGENQQRGSARIVPRVATLSVAEALPRLFSDEKFSIDWRDFGRQRVYGNGQVRPLLRGWVHLLALAVAEVVLASNMLPSTAASLVRWSSVGMYGSVAFHMVPWSTASAYQIALFLDFVCIRLVKLNS